MAEKTDNRTCGGRFEQELSHRLAEAGFWVHAMQQNKAGQPADLIAIKGKYHTLIDCKVISDGRGFPLDRVEENQRTAMALFSKRADEACFFAIRLPDRSIWMISNGVISMNLMKGVKRLPEEFIRKTFTLDEWIKEADNWSKDI